MHSQNHLAPALAVRSNRRGDSDYCRVRHVKRPSCVWVDTIEFYCTGDIHHGTDTSDHGLHCPYRHVSDHLCAYASANIQYEHYDDTSLYRNFSCGVAAITRRGRRNRVLPRRVD